MKTRNQLLPILGLEAERLKNTHKDLKQKAPVSYRPCGCAFIHAQVTCLWEQMAALSADPIMKEQSETHGKSRSGLWMKLCQLHTVLLPNFTHGQQESLFRSCPKKVQALLPTVLSACCVAAARSHQSTRSNSALTV